ncbi:MAG TPA: DUF169 domain-containing protein [Acidobacteriaceae bacterium]|nr:DUF169 domain-containing protein [Acidobacteriaceae bacterium]
MSYSQLAGVLTASLDLHQPPIAISFTEELPAGVSAYSGRVPAGCKFWEEGAKAAFATTASDHSLCAIGVYTHNLQPSPGQQADLTDALRVFADLEYVRPQDLALIPVLGSQPAHVMYAPLAETPTPPDVVILFVNASQTLILSEATQQVENQSAPAMGRPACAIVPQVVNTGRAALSLGCCGARAYLDGLTDDTAIFAIPGSRLEAYTRRIEALTKANSVLARFHQLRRHEIAGGATPTIKDSLAALAG